MIHDYDYDPDRTMEGDPMDPNPMHYIYKAAIFTVLGFGTELTQFTNQLNVEASAGWHPDKIIRWDDYKVLVIFIGISEEGPDHGNATQ